MFRSETGVLLGVVLIWSCISLASLPNRKSSIVNKESNATLPGGCIIQTMICIYSIRRKPVNHSFVSYSTDGKGSYDKDQMGISWRFELLSMWHFQQQSLYVPLDKRVSLNCPRKRENWICNLVRAATNTCPIKQTQARTGMKTQTSHNKNTSHVEFCIQQSRLRIKTDKQKHFHVHFFHELTVFSWWSKKTNKQEM